MSAKLPSDFHEILLRLFVVGLTSAVKLVPSYLVMLPPLPTIKA